MKKILEDKKVFKLSIIGIGLIVVGLVISFILSLDKKESIQLYKEERYLNGYLQTTVTYDYKSNGLVEGTNLKYNCKNPQTIEYNSCKSIYEEENAGLYKYWKKIGLGSKIDVLYVKDMFSLNTVALYLDNDGNTRSKYAVDGLLDKEEFETEVKYSYDKDGRLIKRVTYDHENKDTIKSEVTLEYKNDLLIKETFNFTGGSKYVNNYEYDDHNNITIFTVDYVIAKDDGMFYDSDTFENTGGYTGHFIATYDNTYENDYLKTIEVDIKVNDTFEEAYHVTREYDDNKNVVIEEVKRTKYEDKDRVEELDIDINDTFTRKLYYKKVDIQSNKYDYISKINKEATKSYSLVDYITKDDNWLNEYNFFVH